MQERLEQLYLDCLPVYGKYAKNMRFTTKENIMKAIELWPKYLKYVTDQDEDMIMLAVQKYGDAIKYAAFQTTEICMTAIKNDTGFNFRLPFTDPLYIKEFIRTHSFSTSDFNIYIYTQFLPFKYVKDPTDEMIFAAVKHNPANIEYVNELKPELLELLPIKHDFLSMTIQDIRKQLLTLEVITKDPSLIYYLANPTDDMFRVAIKQCPTIAKRAPDYLLEELYEINPNIAKFVADLPEHLIQDARKRNILVNDEDIPREKYWDMLRTDVNNFIKLQNPDEDMIWYALKKCSFLISNVKNPTEEMIEYAIEDDFHNFFSVPLTEERKMRAIKKEPWSAQNLVLTDEMIEYLVETNYQFVVNKSQATERCFSKWPCAIKFMPNTELNQLSAVTRDGLSLIFIENPSEKVCLHAVRQNGMALMHVKNKTRNIILVALLQDPHSIVFLENPSDEYIRIACGETDFCDEAKRFLVEGDESVFD